MADRPDYIDAEFEVVSGPAVQRVENDPLLDVSPTWVDKVAVWISTILVGGLAIWIYPKLFAVVLSVVDG
ncbi:MAG: hypothetical protein Q8K11_01960 [Phenylobacterium sp.]|uniref:hypothetical protein n=1 Tax=Phenylobacterium sp. TaxID=1871053 RepID=UPI00272FDAB4|nr:hypothetical protein [Phenylobacterium sp.]MDP2008918.1 hypothetical protein [Phenylobacterium sp.]